MNSCLIKSSYCNICHFKKPYFWGPDAVTLINIHLQIRWIIWALFFFYMCDYLGAQRSLRSLSEISGWWLHLWILLLLFPFTFHGNKFSVITHHIVFFVHQQWVQKCTTLWAANYMGVVFLWFLYRFKQIIHLLVPRLLASYWKGCNSNNNDVPFSSDSSDIVFPFTVLNHIIYPIYSLIY